VEGYLSFKISSRIWTKAAPPKIGRNNLLSQYLRLYSLTLDRRLMVGEVGGWEESVWRWRLRWRRKSFE